MIAARMRATRCGALAGSNTQPMSDPEECRAARAAWRQPYRAGAPEQAAEAAYEMGEPEK